MKTETLDHYTVLEELRRSAFGRVFLAFDPRLDRQVALWTVEVFERLPAGEHVKALERFLGQARAAIALDHENLVVLHEVGQTSGLLYIATEYVEATSLEPFCTPTSRLPLATVIELIACAAEAIGHAHRAEIVHGNLQPAQLLRVFDRTVKVAGFGLALVSSERPAADEPPVGKAGYMSPEQIRGAPFDGRSDLFSLGVILFELLTGRKPFPGDSPASVMYRTVHEEVVHPAGDAPLPPELLRLLDTALAKRPEDRFRTGEEMALALRRVGRALAGAGPAGTSPALAPGVDHLPPAAPGARAPRAMATWLIGSGVVLALAVAALFILRDGGAAAPAKPAPAVWLETRVRTEPAGLEVRLDGVPLDPTESGSLRFRAEGPFGNLSVASGCRTVERRLDPADAGNEVVLVLDPSRMDWRIEPAAPRAGVKLNGRRVGAAPVDLALDLCRENRVEVEAPGYAPARIEIPAGATPLEARTLLYGLGLEEIPRGKLVLPETDVQLVYTVDGKRVGRSDREIELEAGKHELRFQNEYHWIDRRISVQVQADQRTLADIGPLPRGTLVVQAFPSNCRVYLRERGGRWRYLDDTPATRQVATGRYEVKVEQNATGKSEIRQIEVAEGTNPPVRVAFAKGG